MTLSEALSALDSDKAIFILSSLILYTHPYSYFPMPLSKKKNVGVLKVNKVKDWNYAFDFQQNYAVNNFLEFGTYVTDCENEKMVQNQGKQNEKNSQPRTWISIPFEVPESDLRSSHSRHASHESCCLHIPRTCATPVTNMCQPFPYF